MKTGNHKTPRNKQNQNIDINCINFFLRSLMGKGNKSKNDKVDLIKLKCIFAANETTNKINGQPTEWRKYLQMI